MCITHHFQELLWVNQEWWCCDEYNEARGDDGYPECAMQIGLQKGMG